MTSRSDFTDEEWALLGRAPILVGTAISISDPGGPIETLKESSAALRTIADAAREAKFGALAQAVAQDLVAKAQRRENPLAGFAPDRRNPLADVLAELRAVNALLVDKATDDELADFREFLRTTAQQAALAAKEGGFFGIGAERVSEREQQMLEQLGEIFGSPRGG